MALSRQIANDIRTGRVRCGERLLSSRLLAKQTGLHRNTILAAYAELTAQGWIETKPGLGTFVSRDVPTSITVGKQAHASPTYRVNASPELLNNKPRKGVLKLGGGTPDTRLVPAVELSRAIRRALRRAPTLLDYGDPHGTLRLRKAIAHMLRERRGMVVDYDSVIITRGSQMGIYLLGQALLRAGDCVAVESLGYRPAWQALRMSGAHLTPIPIDEHGMRIDQLRERHVRKKIRAVYLTPHHQFPTLVTLSASRRLELMDFASRNHVAIIEDDYDHEFHFEGRPVLPMASDDESGNVVYVGTLSKVLAPGLRIGYAVAPPALINNLAALRSHMDSQGDSVMESAVAEWMEEGELERHTRRMRKIYRERRTALVSALHTHLADEIEFEIPTGGMALWVKAKSDIDVDTWTKRALDAGVQISPASLHRFDRRNSPFMRLGFAKLDPEELTKAVQIVANVRSC